MLGEKRTLSTLKYNKCAFLFLRLCLFSLYFTFLPFYNPPPPPPPPFFFCHAPFLTLSTNPMASQGALFTQWGLERRR